MAVGRLVAALVFSAWAAWAACVTWSTGAVLAAQGSPFDGIWVAEVPLPDGPTVRFTLMLSVDDEGPKGTLRIGAAKPVPIENARLRGDVLSFRRNLGEGEGSIMFLARVLDDGMHVGFMQRPPEGTSPSSGSSKVVNFTAKRLTSRAHP